MSGYARRVLLSDRDIRSEIAAGRLGIDPFEDALVQPSSVDVRLDNLFRVFNNTRYTHIDPSRSRMTYDMVSRRRASRSCCIPVSSFSARRSSAASLPGDLAGRLEGKSSPRPPRAVDPLHGRIHRPRASPATSRWSCPTSPTCRSRCGRA